MFYLDEANKRCTKFLEQVDNREPWLDNVKDSRSFVSKILSSSLMVVLWKLRFQFWVACVYNFWSEVDRCFLLAVLFIMSNKKNILLVYIV